MINNTVIDEFANWFRNESSRLLGLPALVVADELGERLIKIDDRLGVEVERSGADGTREVIFTAFSDARAFPIVRSLVAQIGVLSGWNLKCLKPARGFGFSLKVGGKEISARKLRFRPIRHINCGFELLIPDVSLDGDGADEVAWLMVETGIGEEIAGRINHLEFTAGEFGTDSTWPIDELAKYVQSNCPNANGS